MRFCSKCGLGERTKDQTTCKLCQKLYRDSHKEQIKLGQASYYGKNKSSVKAAVAAYRKNNLIKVRKAHREYYIKTITERMLFEAKKRADKFNLPFSITAEDIVIPKLCPVLGIELKISEGKPSAESPSLDRIVPSLGYIKSNIKVISHRANRIKTDASLKELRQVYEYVVVMTSTIATADRKKKCQN